MLNASAGLAVLCRSVQSLAPEPQHGCLQRTLLKTRATTPQRSAALSVLGRIAAALLVWPAATDVAWYVRLCVRWSQPRAVQKPMNRWRCRWSVDLGGPRKPCPKWSGPSQRKGHILGGERCKTFNNVFFCHIMLVMRIQPCRLARSHRRYDCKVFKTRVGTGIHVSTSAPPDEYD